MKYSEIGFRGIYHNFWAVLLTPNLYPVVETFPDIDKADHLLTYGYIDRDAGLTLEILAGAKKNKNSFRFFDTNASVKAMVRIGAVEESEFYYFEDESGNLKKRFSEKIDMLSSYDVDEEREISFLLLVTAISKCDQRIPRSHFDHFRGSLPEENAIIDTKVVTPTYLGSYDL